MEKPTRTMTTGETEAYWQGHRDGMAKAERLRQQKVGPHIECKSAQPDVMCRDCRCWKMTREYCS
jgi:hypothetical protein